MSTWRTFLRHATSIVAAIGLGTAVDLISLGSEKRDTPPYRRIATQFAVNIGIIMLLRGYAPKHWMRFTTENIFFVSVFLGMQQNLFNTLHKTVVQRLHADLDGERK